MHVKVVFPGAYSINDGYGIFDSLSRWRNGGVEFNRFGTSDAMTNFNYFVGNLDNASLMGESGRKIFRLTSGCSNSTINDF